MDIFASRYIFMKTFLRATRIKRNGVLNWSNLPWQVYSGSRSDPSERLFFFPNGFLIAGINGIQSFPRSRGNTGPDENDLYLDDGATWAGPAAHTPSGTAGVRPSLADRRSR